MQMSMIAHVREYYKKGMFIDLYTFLVNFQICNYNIDIHSLLSKHKKDSRLNFVITLALYTYDYFKNKISNFKKELNDRVKAIIQNQTPSHFFQPSLEMKTYIIEKCGGRMDIISLVENLYDELDEQKILESMVEWYQHPI